MKNSKVIFCNKVKSFVVMFLITISQCYSQTQEIIGEIKNAQSQESLPYVNIGIADKTVGTVSDSKGMFSLFVNDKTTSKDTVTFSHIGFKTEKYVVSELSKKKNVILLVPEDTQLDDVVVVSKKTKLKSKNIGRTSKGIGLTHMNFYSYYEKDVNDRLSKETGMKLKIRRNCNLKSLNFNITSNDFTSLKFRVNFYKIEDGLPTDLIVQKDIIFEIKDSFLGWFKVDLEPYNIYFKEDVEEVAVTIQWLESVKRNETSKYFAISTAASPLNTSFFREKALDTWSKSNQSLSFYLRAMCE